MKKKFKKFLKTVNLDRENQLCYPNERKVCERLLEKGWVSKIDYNETHDQFFIYLSKKGLKKALKVDKIG